MCFRRLESVLRHCNLSVLIWRREAGGKRGKGEGGKKEGKGRWGGEEGGRGGRQSPSAPKLALSMILKSTFLTKLKVLPTDSQVSRVAIRKKNLLGNHLRGLQFEGDFS